MKHGLITSLVVFMGAAIWGFSSISLPGDDFEDDAEIELLFQSALDWYGPADITFEGCELRLVIHTGTTCANPSHRKFVKIVFDFSEFESFLLPRTSSQTLGFILYFDDDAKGVLGRARAILREEKEKLTNDLTDTTQYMSENFSSGVKTETCNGHVEFLPDLSDSLNLYVDADVAHIVEKVIERKIISCDQ